MPLTMGGGGGGGGGGGAVSGVFFCNPASGLVVGDVVYIDSANHVEKACAAAPPAQTPDAIGIVSAIIAANLVWVTSDGPVIVPGPLVVGANYWLGLVAGTMTTTAPTGAGEKVQQIGVAAGNTRFWVDVDSSDVLL